MDPWICGFVDLWILDLGGRTSLEAPCKKNFQQRSEARCELGGTEL